MGRGHSSDRRLNPFVFPPATSIWFVLLIATAAATAATVANMAFVASGQYRDISLIPSPDITQSVGSDANFSATLETSGAIIVNLGSVLIVVGAVLGIAAVRHWRHPARIRRKNKLVLFPIENELDRSFMSEIQSFAASVGVEPHPSIETTPGSRTTDGQAFGFRRRYAIKLGGSLPLLMLKQRPKFEATVLHELAHLANRDIGRSYYTEALWTVLSVVILIPAILVPSISFIITTIYVAVGGFMGVVLPGTFRIGLGAWLVIAQMWTQLIVILVVATFTRRQILREREIYADWRAAVWGAKEGLVARLKEEATRQPAQQTWWQRIGSFHPSPEKRIVALNDPSTLFRLPNSVPIVIGILTGIMLPTMSFFGTSLALSSGSLWAVVERFFAGLTGLEFSLPLSVVGAMVTLLLAISPIILTGFFVVGTLGSQIQRNSVIVGDSQKKGTRTLWLGKIAGLFALGVQLGLWAAPFNTAIPPPDEILLSPITNPIFALSLPLSILVWVAVFTATTWLWLAMLYWISKRLFTTHIGGKAPRRANAILAILLSMQLSVVLAAMHNSQKLIYLPIDANPPSPVVLIAIVVILLSVPILMLGLGAGELAFVEARLHLGKRTCPVCETAIPHQNVIGQRCFNCGNELASWLYVNPDEA